MTIETDLVEALKQKEQESGLSSASFAKVVGISASLWSMTRSGERPLGIKLADAAARCYPELERLALLFFRYELPTRKSHFATSNGVDREETVIGVANRGEAFP